jgi:signal transduction histidine kinase
MVGAVGAARDTSTAPAPRGGAAMALSLHAAFSVLLGVLCAIVWGATGGGEFWPMWVWFALAIPVGLHALIFDAVRRPPSRDKALLVHAQATGFVAAILLTIYVLAGFGTFWPAWPLFGLAAALGAHGIVARREQLPQARERELVERVDELTRTRRGALDVQAAELRRIERDLHDGAQARLVALSMLMGRAEERLEDRPEVAELVRRAREEASAAIGELRDLARGIAPPVLADRGLQAAIEALAGRSLTPVTVEARITRRPPPVVETAAYFVAAEGITNVAKHGRGAAALVVLDADADRVVVTISDDGPGGANPTGSGLTGLRHRVEALDGTLDISSEPGATRLRAVLPCGS